MFTILKCLKGIFLLRQITETYRNETGKDKPALLSRRFIGALTVSGGAIATLYSGVNIDAGMLTGIEEHLSKVTDTSYQIYLLFKSIIPDMIFLWGVVMVIIGWFKREKKPIQ